MAGQRAFDFFFLMNLIISSNVLCISLTVTYINADRFPQIVLISHPEDSLTLTFSCSSGFLCPSEHSGLFLNKGFVVWLLPIVGVRDMCDKQPLHLKYGGKEYSCWES